MALAGPAAAVSGDPVGLGEKSDGAKGAFGQWRFNPSERHAVRAFDLPTPGSIKPIDCKDYVGGFCQTKRASLQRSQR